MLTFDEETILFNDLIWLSLTPRMVEAAEERRKMPDFPNARTSLDSEDLIQILCKIPEEGRRVCALARKRLREHYKILEVC